MSKYYKAEDVIRKRAEDLADTSYWEYGNPKNVDEWIEVAEMEFQDLPTIEVSEDCISREYLLSKVYDMDNDNLVVDLKDIENAPSVVSTTEQSSMVGEWINDTKYSGWTCTNCNYHDGNATDKYCPNCGAKMKG